MQQVLAEEVVHAVKPCASWVWEVVDCKMIAAGAVAVVHLQMTDEMDVGTGDVNEAEAEVHKDAVQRTDIAPCDIAVMGEKEDWVASRGTAVAAALSLWMKAARH